MPEIDRRGFLHHEGHRNDGPTFVSPQSRETYNFAIRLDREVKWVQVSISSGGDVESIIKTVAPRAGVTEEGFYFSPDQNIVGSIVHPNMYYIPAGKPKEMLLYSSSSRGNAHIQKNSYSVSGLEVLSAPRANSLERGVGGVFWETCFNQWFITAQMLKEMVSTGLITEEQRVEELRTISKKLYNLSKLISPPELVRD